MSNRMYVLKCSNGKYLSKKKSCLYLIEDEIKRAGMYLTKGQASIAQDTANKRFDGKYTFEIINIEVREAKE